MLQLVQDLKAGKMTFLDVPFADPGPGHIQVRVHYSALSPGTEGRTVRDARASLIGKAKSRPAEVQKAIQLARVQGLRSTCNLIRQKLQAPAPLGYSCSGEVIATGAGVRSFRAGDRVTCGGASANHAEVVTVAKNLCAAVPAQVDMAHASLTTIAAIALQGIRQAEVRLGESCVVIGLGLIGQLTMLLLNAAGVQALGIDVEERQVNATRMLPGCDAWLRSEPGMEESILKASGGQGADAVIITAGSLSLDPVETAGVLSRKKGRVVIVGAVPTGFSRTNYYRKELELRMSTSYGPGRYDPVYEERGIDYPIGYVRWTEQRNMQAFLNLLEARRVDVAPLITHRFPYSQAPQAYELILNKKETFNGVILEYDIHKALEPDIFLHTERIRAVEEPGIGLIGTGNFAHNILLPALKKAAIGEFIGVSDSQGAACRHAADKYNFSFASGDLKELLLHPRINTLFIASRHNGHAEQVLEGLRAGKHVFVEKPLCMNESELEKIAKAYRERSLHLMVGFNRRFAPLVQLMRQNLPADAPRAIHYRINAGQIPGEHWVHDPETGGGRIIGEACHFIDLAMFLAGAPCTSVSAEAMRAEPQLLDSVAIQLGFANGSVASISYLSNGCKTVHKEDLQVFSGGVAAHLVDFQSLQVYDNSGKRTYKGHGDKGHQNEVAAFLQAIQNGTPTPIPFGDLFLSMLATFKVIESISSGKRIILERG